MTHAPLAAIIAAMPATSPVYRALTAVASAGLGAVAGIDAKLARGHAGRRESVAIFSAWAARHRDPARPLLWFHAPSVGEGLQADAVLRRIRRDHPDWQLAYTWFSPSAESWAQRLNVDVRGYLPYDSPANAAAMLDALRPSALVFSKLDLWPELAVLASGRKIPVAMIAATVRPGSGRLRWPVRELLAPGYQSVIAAAAIASDDAERLSQLGVARERIQLAGDPRFDSAHERVEAVRPDDPLLRFGAAAPTLVAGSTWPGDEAVILGAMVSVRNHFPEARLILVPHEPTPEHLTTIERQAATLSLPAPVRLSLASIPVPILLVDTVGVLAALYGSGTMAYVGGGFHGAGLHSVLEPAAWGRPVSFGPRWGESRDAVLLAQAGGAWPVASEATSDAVSEFANIWSTWIADGALRTEQGDKALSLVRGGLGAADRCASMIGELVQRPAR